jgi:hypothetical protein
LATIHVKDNPEIIYNLLPIVKKSIKKRSLNNYDSNMNSHAIIKGNIRDLKFDTIDSKLNCII